MNIETIVDLITTLGFPIVCVLVLGIFVYKLWKQSVEREKALMKEITENRAVNEKAIETIALYTERLAQIENNVSEIKSDVVLIKERVQ